MCDIDIDETCDVWVEKTVKARKEHQCHSCHLTIEPGKEYLRLFAVFEGQVSTEKICASCRRDFEAFKAEHNQYYYPSQVDLMLQNCIDDAETFLESAKWRRRLKQLERRRERSKLQVSTDTGRMSAKNPVKSNAPKEGSHDG